MMEAWGILEPADIPSARRLQSLRLTSAIRHFNERAVPGMGGLWFAMPLIWSMLGIAIAQKPDRRPIEVANAIEALAMKLAIDDGDGTADLRVRGRRNLPRVGRSFEDLKKPGSYVTQTFRQSCTQPLVTLGLVEGTSGRFNSFRLAPDGGRLLEPLAAVRCEIEKWVGGDKRHDWGALSAIAPTAGLPPAVLAELMRRTYGNGAAAERRKAIHAVGGKLTSDVILNTSPKGLAPDHLADLRGGIATVRLREAALQVLGEVENRIAKRRDDGLAPTLALAEADLDDHIRAKITACVGEAERAAPHIQAVRDEKESLAFLRDCQTADGLLQRLARRDGMVIVLRDGVLAPGPAFGADAVAGDIPAAAASGVPELPRIGNLLALTDDLSAATARTLIGKATE
ncbi:hypothetical protein [Xanthobacter autotrophicus]|uniref:hypothetical protein n=1 Tax=Xanthobacter autotrophicus TaxID=280 RepID=UPI00372651A7